MECLSEPLIDKELFNNILLSIKTKSVSNLRKKVLRFVTIYLLFWVTFLLMLKKSCITNFFHIRKSRNILNLFLRTFKSLFFFKGIVGSRDSLTSKQKDGTNNMKGEKPRCKSYIFQSVLILCSIIDIA